jgi:hypothetical protein
MDGLPDTSYSSVFMNNFKIYFVVLSVLSLSSCTSIFFVLQVAHCGGRRWIANVFIATSRSSILKGHSKYLLVSLSRAQLKTVQIKPCFSLFLFLCELLFSPRLVKCQLIDQEIQFIIRSEIGIQSSIRAGVGSIGIANITELWHQNFSLPHTIVI